MDYKARVLSFAPCVRIITHAPFTKLPLSFFLVIKKISNIMNQGKIETCTRKRRHARETGAIKSRWFWLCI